MNLSGSRDGSELSQRGSVPLRVTASPLYLIHFPSLLHYFPASFHCVDKKSHSYHMPWSSAPPHVHQVTD